METDFSSRWAKRMRVLTLGLILSGALNVALLASFVFYVLKDKETSFSLSLPSKGERTQEATIGSAIQSLAKLSFRELVSYLTNRDLVEEGYTKRDLAVAALVGFHHFNLDKALGTPPAQKRTVALEGDKKIEMFPGLADDQFEAVIRYAYQEKWPLTSKGLFCLLQKPGICDESLIQAFSLTPEFYSLTALFQKTEAPQNPAVLLKLVSEGNWDLLERFSHEQEQMLDLSLDKRRRLLLSYLSLQSPTAAQLLLQTDFAFALKRLDDRGVLDLLSLLKEKSEASQKYCAELLRSPRSDAVLQAAAQRLYFFTGETASASMDLKEAVAKFAPQPAEVPAPEPAPAPAAIPQAPAFKTHVVKEGESLWKIARQYKIKVDELVRLNEIEKDKLFPGMTLRIPQGTGSEPPR